MRSGVAGAVAAVLLVAGCTSPATRTGSREASLGSGWAACPEVAAEYFGETVPGSVLDQLTDDIQYECTTVTVPRDWDDPDRSGTFDLALVRARHTDQRRRIGSLLVNPGGPGGSGIESAVYLSFGPGVGGLPAEVMERFDLVGFDPRGVGDSSPVECLTGEELDASFGAEPDPVADDAFDAMVADTRAEVDTCAAKYGEALRYFSTRQTAHDLEALRVAVGDERLTYLGFSYGTLIGAVYAHLYPERVRAMVLDGAVDPTEDEAASAGGQAEGFERALDNFAAWCADTGDVCPLAPDARGAVVAAIDDARTDPLPGGDGREATAGWVFWAVVASLYADEVWPDLAGALADLADGDPEGVFAIADSYTGRRADGSYPNLFDANSAITCADQAETLSLAEIRDRQGRWRERYPVFGAPLATSLVGCAVWPVEPDPYPVGPADGAPPILVVGTRGDPATPYEATARLADLLGTGVVLTYEGDGHTAYPGPDCVDDAVDAYLVDLTVPDEGTTCPA